MELRPGYKQTEVGVIPRDWRVATVRELASIKTGKRNTEDRVGDGVYPFFVRSQVVERINSYSSDGEAVLTAGDGVGTGNVFHYIQGRFDFHQRVYRISDFSPELNGFFFFLYFSSHFYDRIMSMTAKSSVDSVRMEMIADMAIPVAPLPEQRAIAAALGDVDALLGALTQLIAKKREVKQAAIQQLLTGQTRLPGFNGEWEVKYMKDIAPLQRGFDLPTSKIRQGRHPVVYSNGVLNHHSSFMVKGPGVVTGRSGTIGNVHFVEEDFWPHNTSLWVTSFKGNNAKFVFYLLASIGIERFKTGSGVPTLNRNDVHSHQVRIPRSTEEQTAIAAVLSDMDAELAALEQRLAKTRALKRGMMQELLTGRVRLPVPA
jgi:type I restriction enzyme S subunit